MIWEKAPKWAVKIKIICSCGTVEFQARVARDTWRGKGYTWILLGAVWLNLSSF